jgi:hypothetical protein
LIDVRWTQDLLILFFIALEPKGADTESGANDVTVPAGKAA